MKGQSSSDRNWPVSRQINSNEKTIPLLFNNPPLVAHLNLGLVLTSLNRRQEALAIYEHLLKIDDDGLKDPKTHANTQRSARTNMGRLLIELDRPVDAIEVLSRARKEPPPAGGGNAQGILNLLGEAYQALNKSDQAEQWYRAAMAEKPDHIPAYLKYGKLLAKNVSIVDISSSFSLVHGYSLFIRPFSRRKLGCQRRKIHSPRLNQWPPRTPQFDFTTVSS